VFTAVWSTALAVFVGLLAGFLVNAYVGRPADWVISACQVVGAAVILAATLALLGWEIQSWKGQTLAEKTNRWLFRSQYWAGTAVFVFSRYWSLVPK